LSGARRDGARPGGPTVRGPEGDTAAGASSVRYLPIIVLSIGLVSIVMAMAGNRERSLRTGVGIGVVVLALIVMAALFAIVVRRTLGS
jgi:hypothetical protein